MEKLNILLVSVKVTQEHASREQNEMIRTLLESTGRFHVVIVEEFRNITPKFLEPYDAVLINHDGKDWPTDQALTFGEQSEQALYDFEANGKGIIIYHSTIWGDDWPDEFRKLMGGCALMEKGCRRYPKDDFEVKMEDTEHPITKGVDETWLTVHEDLFTTIYWHPESDVHVLASAYDDVEVYRKANFPPKHHPVKIPGGKLENMEGVNQYTPIMWTNNYGKGRTFVTTIGHGIGTLYRPNFITLFVRGVEWAAAGEVTLDAPDRSGDNRLKPWPFY